MTWNDLSLYRQSEELELYFQGAKEISSSREKTSTVRVGVKSWLQELVPHPAGTGAPERAESSPCLHGGGAEFPEVD